MLTSWFLDYYFCVSPQPFELLCNAGAGFSFATWLMVSFFQSRGAVAEESRRDMPFIAWLHAPINITPATGSSLSQYWFPSHLNSLSISETDSSLS